jgi:hypothetical protein
MVLCVSVCGFVCECVWLCDCMCVYMCVCVCVCVCERERDRGCVIILQNMGTHIANCSTFFFFFFYWYYIRGWDLMSLRLRDSSSFKRWGRQPHTQSPIWRTRIPSLFWVIAFDLSGKGGPASSNATACIVLSIP